MESKVSNAQLEVWSWKEKIYEMVKDLPPEKAIELLIARAKENQKKLAEKEVGEKS